MAVNRVERLLRDVTRALSKKKIPHAIVGGNAVAAWVASVDAGAVRATKDVDILLRREDLAAVEKALSPLNLVMIEVMGVFMFVDKRRPNPRTGVHVIFAREKVRPEHTHAAPDTEQSVASPSGYRVVDLASLVRMKLQAFRLLDRVHLLDLLQMGLIDDGLIKSLPNDLRKRLDAVRAEET